MDDLAAAIADLVNRDAVTIPPYPSIAMRLRQLVQSNDFGVGELARVVAEDQVLTAAVLRAANSASARGVRAITALPDAISRIGAEETCRVALAVSLGRMASGDGPLAELRRVAWRQAMGSALCCEHLARARGLDLKEAFVCGLLHDFGKVVVIAAIESLLRARRDQAHSEATWAALVDRFHVDVGGLTAARWKLSTLLCTVIGLHHRPDEAGEYRPMIEVVLATDEVTELLERTPYVLERDVLTLSSIRGKAEAAALMRVLPLIPPFLTGLDDLTTPPTDGGHIAKETVLLKGAQRDVTWNVTWLRAGSEVGVVAERAAQDGLVVRSREALREGNLVHLVIELPSREPLRVAARVLRTRRELAVFHSEVRFFNLDQSARTTWEGAYRTA